MGGVVKEGFWEEVAGVLIVDRILPTASVWRWTSSISCLGVVQAGSSGNEWKFRRIGERRKRRKEGRKERGRENKGKTRERTKRKVKVTHFIQLFFFPFFFVDI